MKKAITILILLLLIGPRPVMAKDGRACRIVRLADIGWTDVAAITAITSELLKALGYETEISILSTPVTFSALKNGDLDIFLGNWMPTQEADIRPYLDDGSIVQVVENLQGAKFTLAVPEYVYRAGVRSFSDLAGFAKNFSKAIYGIEPGNDGNRLILKMIHDNAFGLGSWRLIQSSEQGMLVALKEAVGRKEFIVFLGWAPHPMNLNFSLRYLTGGEDYFGQDQGASEVYTVSRPQFLSMCPNVLRLLKNLKFSVPMEDEIMGYILNDGLSPTSAAQKWLINNPADIAVWLREVKTAEGRPPALEVNKYLKGLSDNVGSSFFRIPLGHWMEQWVLFFTETFDAFFDKISQVIEAVVDKTTAFLLMPHWGIIIGIFVIITSLLHRSIKLFFLVSLGLLLIVNLGLWPDAIKTLVLITFASTISITFGVPLGVLIAKRRIFYAVARPILDLMQTIPTFVYLIPTLMLFGIGIAPGLISTVIFSIAAPIRLTCVGIKQVPVDLLEASRSFGATNWQTLIKVEMPCAMPMIMAGLNQCIMLSLSMVVIAALVGADGLGAPVIRALNTVDIGLGFESGIAIVILAIVLDRTISFNKFNHMN